MQSTPIPNSKVSAYPTLFKKTKTGAVQIWYIEQMGYKYRVVSGQQDGKLTRSEWTEAKAKNEGRANERRPKDQADFEIAAAYEKKIKTSYHETIDTIESTKIFEPMLAVEYKKVKEKIDWTKPNYSQPKLDGMRCIAKADSMRSRTGEKIVSAPHIEAYIKPIFDISKKIKIDGELYNHVLRDDFNEIMSMLRKTIITDEAKKKSKELVQYHVYDLPSSDEVFSKRFSELEALVEALHQYWENKGKKAQRDWIQVVKTHKALHPGDIDSSYELYLQNGYEGQMVRSDTVYENKRTKALLKRKETIDAEFMCTDILPGEGNWAGAAKVAWFIDESGRKFKGTPTGTKAFCRDILKNKEKYIGKYATLSYGKLSPAGVPIWPRVKQWDRIDFTPPEGTPVKKLTRAERLAGIVEGPTGNVGPQGDPVGEPTELQQIGAELNGDVVAVLDFKKLPSLIHNPKAEMVITHKPLAPIADGQYRVIYADPPWHFKAHTEERSGTPRQIEGDHYDTMSLEDMKALPVADSAAKDCALFMWVIGSHLKQAIELGEAWGFTYKTDAFIWAKLTKEGKRATGMGFWSRKQAEYCLLFTRGKPGRMSKGVRQMIEDVIGDDENFIDAPRREHSRKPDEVYEKIEALVPGPYLEMFARTTREGWTVFGNETDKFTAADHLKAVTMTQSEYLDTLPKKKKRRALA